MSARFLPLAAILLAPLLSGQSKAQRELEAGKPDAAIFPPPMLIEVKARKNTLEVKFREMGLDRIVRYELFVKNGSKWDHVTATDHSPLELEACKNKRATYALSAVDVSETIGERRIFDAGLWCTKAKAAPHK